MTRTGDLILKDNVKRKVDVMSLTNPEEQLPRVLDQIFREQDVRRRIDTEEADQFSLTDWIVLFRDELDTLRVSDDWQEIFNAFLQIRHFAQRALISHVRKSLDDQAA